MTFWSDVEYSVVSLVVITRSDCNKKFAYFDFLERYTCFFLSRLFGKEYLFLLISTFLKGILVFSGLGVPSHIRSSPAGSTQHRVWSGSSSSENCSRYYRVAPALHYQHGCHLISAHSSMLYSSSSSL